jgi:chromosome segregation ATPase
MSDDIKDTYENRVEMYNKNIQKFDEQLTNLFDKYNQLQTEKTKLQEQLNLEQGINKKKLSLLQNEKQELTKQIEKLQEDNNNLGDLFQTVWRFVNSDVEEIDTLITKLKETMPDSKHILDSNTIKLLNELKTKVDAREWTKIEPTQYKGLLTSLIEKNRDLYSDFNGLVDKLKLTETQIEDEKQKSSKLQMQHEKLQQLFEKCKQMSDTFNTKIVETTKNIDNLLSPTS